MKGVGESLTFALVSLGEKLHDIFIEEAVVAEKTAARKRDVAESILSL